jgi:hypothetical protein
MTLDEMTTLGRELRRLDQFPHVQALRVLYARTRAGQAPRPYEWTHAHAERIASILGTRNPMPVCKRCPKCPASISQSWDGSRVVTIVAHRVARQCSRCDSEWVDLQPACLREQRRAMLRETRRSGLIAARAA